MNLERELHQRSGSRCELSGATENLQVYEVPKSPGTGLDTHILLSQKAIDQIEGIEKPDPNFWRCLNESMWSEVPVVQVMAWRMLNRLQSEGWPRDLLDMLYLDEETLAWAQATEEGQNEDDMIKHVDANGTILNTGDNVVLIKDLDVKGANFTAKRGTAVRNISLVHDNAEHLEGRVNGQHIVILTKFVKKS